MLQLECLKVEERCSAVAVRGYGRFTCTIEQILIYIRWKFNQEEPSLAEPDTTLPSLHALRTFSPRPPPAETTRCLPDFWNVFALLCNFACIWILKCSPSTSWNMYDFTVQFCLYLNSEMFLFHKSCAVTSLWLYIAFCYQIQGEELFRTDIQFGIYTRSGETCFSSWLLVLLRICLIGSYLGHWKLRATIYHVPSWFTAW